jgi:hypothetical protein
LAGYQRFVIRRDRRLESFLDCFALARACAAFARRDFGWFGKPLWHAEFRQNGFVV